MYINWEPKLYFQPNSLSLDPLVATHGIPLPTYGNYGGPGYSAGSEGGKTPETPDPLQPNQVPKDLLDETFYQHDLVYQHFSDGLITDPAKLVEADVLLVKRMDALTYTDPGDPNYDPEAGVYEGFATLAIVGNLATTGALRALSIEDKTAIASAAQGALVNLEAGLAGASGNESRSLHGAFHVFEAHYSDLLSDLVASVASPEAHTADLALFGQYPPFLAGSLAEVAEPPTSFPGADHASDQALFIQSIVSFPPKASVTEHPVQNPPPENLGQFLAPPQQ